MHGLCFTGYYWLTGRRALLKLVDRLEELHRAPRSEIDSDRNRRLFRLLSHASKYVPYYRDLISQSGLSEATAVLVTQSLPILTKDIIRRETKRLVSERLDGKTRWNTSGGSTGEPIQLLQDANMAFYSRATELLFMRWAGHRMGEPHALIWGVPQATFGEGLSLHERLFRLVHNEMYMNCYKITDEDLRAWLRCIEAKRPTLIEAYADAVYELSSLILEEDIRVHPPQGIITSAAVLTPHMRDTITSAFACPVLNRYGSREVSNIACSCTASTELHVNEHTCYVEIVDDNGTPCKDGEEGDILITLLTNYAMPLIRYKIQDRGIWASGSCACGRTSRRLVAVVGRQSDFLVALDGTKINGTALTTLLYPVCCVKRYQYRQTRDGRVILAVVPKDGVNVETVQKETYSSLERLRAMLSGTPVELAVVEEITPSKSGKYSYILNELAAGDLVHGA